MDPACESNDIMTAKPVDTQLPMSLIIEAGTQKKPGGLFIKTRQHRQLCARGLFSQTAGALRNRRCVPSMAVTKTCPAARLRTLRRQHPAAVQLFGEHGNPQLFLDPRKPPEFFFVAEARHDPPPARPRRTARPMNVGFFAVGYV